MVIKGVTAKRQCRRVALPAVRPHDDLDITIERHQETRQALDRKVPEFPAQHSGNVRLRDAEQLAGLDLFSAVYSALPGV
jgi:hypothetical protein